MAASGVVFVVFVLVHMYGNLKAFSGHDAFNEYAAHLRAIGEPELPHEGMLWAIRVVLIGSLAVHVGCAASFASAPSVPPSPGGGGAPSSPTWRRRPASPAT